MILRIDNAYTPGSYVFIYDLLYSQILCKVALKFYDTFMRDYFLYYDLITGDKVF